MTAAPLTRMLAADRERVLRDFAVSRETAARLDRFAAALLQWQGATNLVAPSTLPELWIRHIADSLQLLPLAPDALHWTDLGSGGGFPGLVLACALAERPGASVQLIESNQKKAAFLREAARLTGARARVYPLRIEAFAASNPGPIDVVTARALAPLEQLCAYAYPLLKTGAQALFLKGQDIEAELTQASKCWSIEAELIPSRTEASARIVKVRSLRPAESVPSR